MKPVKAVLFDLDGTLTDTLKLWHRAVCELLSRHGRQPLSLEEYRQRWWGMDGRNKVRALLHPPEEKVGELYEELVGLLMSYVPLVRPLPGVVEAVRRLSRAVPLAVISNGPMPFLEAQLKQAGLQGMFSVQIADAAPKPNPDGILQACRRLSVRPDEAVFVGDSQFDQGAAEAAGVQFILLDENVKRDDALAELLETLGV